MDMLEWHGLHLEESSMPRSSRAILWLVLGLVPAACTTPPPATVEAAEPIYPWCGPPTDSTLSHDCALYSWTDYRTTAMRIRQLYETERFDLLEHALEEFAMQAKTFPDGRSRMSAAYQGFREAISSRQLDPAVAGRNARWRAAIPRSTFVTFADARFEYATAWMARGQCEAECVGSAAWQQFAAHLARAEEILDAAPPPLKDRMFWHLLLLATVQDSHSTRHPPADVFERAVNHWPEEYAFYDLRLTRLTPRWGGSWAEVESSIESWTEAALPHGGRSLYARLYLDLADAGEPLATTDADWPKMRVAFRDLIRRFPDNRYVNLYASYACSVDDAGAFSEALELIGAGAWEEDFWLPSTSMALCTRRFHPE